MNQSIRDIYEDYRYEMLKVGMSLEQLAAENALTPDRVDPLMDRADRLEALVDLYAFLLACQGHGRSR